MPPMIAADGASHIPPRAPHFVADRRANKRGLGSIRASRRRSGSARGEGSDCRGCLAASPRSIAGVVIAHVPAKVGISAVKLRVN
jgi:hypothetical protein